MLRKDLMRPLVESLRSHAATAGDRIAFADRHRSVSYRDLERRTRFVAGHLTELPVVRGDRALVILGNRVETIEAELAVLRACLVGVPVNPDLTDDDLRYLVSDSGARIVFTDDRHAVRLHQLRQELPELLVVLVDDVSDVSEHRVDDVNGAGTWPDAYRFADLAERAPAAQPPDDLDLDDTAWILYTSGTTGDPKGVLSSQRNFLWPVAACNAPIFGLSEQDHMLWPLPLYYSLARTFCIVGVLTTGATATVLDAFSPEAVLAALEREPISFLVGVPTVYHHLLTVAERGWVGSHALRMCLTAGSATAGRLRERFEEAFRIPLLDCYGATETSGAITTNWPGGPQVPGSCGLPVPGLGVRLVDPESGADVEPGAEGEVWVRGPSVALGYHGKPVETSETFQGGWYHTGDLARTDSDGYVTITGRIKELIIRGGENIHPLEIEKVLGGAPGVREAAVGGRPHDMLGEIAAGYVVADPGGVDGQAVLDHCRAHLPSRKVPTTIHDIADIPRTASGKVRRHALAERRGRLLAATDDHLGSLGTVEWTARRADPGPPESTVDLAFVVGVDGDRAELADWLTRTVGDRVVVTTGAVAVDPGEAATVDLDQAQAWGFVRVAHPDVALVDVRGHWTTAYVAAALACGHRESAVRGDTVWTRRTSRITLRQAGDPRRGGCALITGATTELGTYAARRLTAELGVTRIVFLGEPPSGELTGHLTAAGVAIEVSGAGPDDLVLRADPPRFDVVVHAAGDLATACELDRIVVGHTPELVVLSAPRTDPDAHAVTALALDHQASGRPVLAIVWDDLDDARTAFDAAPLLADAVVVTGRGGPEPATGTATSSASSLSSASSESSAGERRGAVLDLVRAAVAELVGLRDGAEVPADRAFSELGLSSVIAVRLRNRLVAATGVDLPVTAIFDHPTPARLTDRLTGTAEPERAATRPVVASAAAPRSSEDPIVIVGMGCRLPGGIRSPEDLWRLLLDGRDAIGDFPVDRGWDLGGLSDTSRVHLGGFVEDATTFDAEFFGISPREALAMDPQQRLLLETTWHTFEDAGIDPASQRGERVGVFAGVMNSGYDMLLRESSDTDVTGHVATGTANSVAAGRVAYWMDWHGPVLSIDTACSSALVGLHLAARSLRAGECDLALAGGVTVMAGPQGFVEFSKLNGLASDGRCKAFSTDADGTSWAEGAALLLVERLSDAQRNAHRVLATLKGSAINHDGASNGLTAPSGPAQRQLLHDALRDAGLAHTDVDFVEAHGTGTPLGDSIELASLHAVYGQDRDRPLRLGSIKSNLGHTQAAAGAVGVLKAVLALRHQMMPRSLHIDRPAIGSPGPIALLAEAQPWPRRDNPRRAGVSAFGASGTNAHLIIEEFAPAPTVDRRDRFPVPWVLSAPSEQALRAQAEALRDFDGDVVGAGQILAGRTRFTHRAVVLGSTPAQFRAATSALAASSDHENLVAVAAPPPGDIVFVFPGQGTQWQRMAVDLLAESPEFARKIREVAAELDPITGWSLVDVLLADTGAPPTTRVDVVQPVLFAMMLGLAELWTTHGVRPDAVVGHSQGEIAAAVFAGALSLRDGARVVALRSVLIRDRLSGLGAMLSIMASEVDVARRIVAWHGRIGTAVVNGPKSTVVAGDTAAIDELAAALAADGVYARKVDVDYASHSPQVAVLRDQLVAALADLTPAVADIPFCSTVTGDFARSATLDADYWYANLRETVRFADAVRRLHTAGARTFVEVSPHPVLASAVDHLDGAWFGETLRRGQGGMEAFLRSTARAHVHGVDVDWRPVLGTGADVALPPYRFDRTRYWPTTRPRTEPPDTVLRPGWTHLTKVRADHQPSWTVVGEACGLRNADVHVDLAALLARVGDLPDTVVYGCSPPLDGLDAAATRHAVGRLARVVRQWLAEDRFASSRLVVLVDTSAPGNLPHAASWAYLSAVQAEHPGRFVLVDAPPSASAFLASALALGERRFRIDGDAVLVPALTPVDESSHPPLTLAPDGTVLVTGGGGALGVEVVRHLFGTHGVRRFVLLSRSVSASPEARELAAELGGLGVSVTLADADAADPRALAAVVAAIPPDRPLTAVVHAAAVVRDGVAGSVDDDTITAVLRPKVDAATALHSVTGEHVPLIVFSSTAAYFGPAGQSVYAAANAAVDALVRHRRAAGSPAISLQWGYWTKRGTATSHLTRAQVSARLARENAAPLSTSRALHLFDLALRANEPVMTLTEVADAPARLIPAQDIRDVGASVRSVVARALGHEVDHAVPADRPLRELGFDSLTSLELRNRLEAVLGLRLPATIAFEHPTVAALTEHLTMLLSPEPAATPDDANDRTDDIDAMSLTSLVAAALDSDRR